MAGEKLVQKALQAAMEARAARHVADPAKRAENLAKWQAQTPKEVTEPTWYHGSLYEVPQFNNDRPAFVTQNPNFANTFASFPKNQSLAGQILDARLSGEPVPQPNVMPMHVRAENPFDYENRAHINKLIMHLQPETYEDPKKIGTLIGQADRGDWNAIEDPIIQKALKELGHDAFFVFEEGNKNLAVMKPTEQFKSATGNLGTFDINSPRLDENRGGEVREHHADGERVGTFDIRAVDPAFGENSLTPREGISLPRAVQLARSIIDAQPSVPAQGAPVDYSLSPQFAGMAHEMGKTPIGAVSVPVMGGNLHLQGGYDPLTKFEHYGARYTRPFADGGAARGHYLFGGDVEYQSNSEPLIKDGVINWGDPENAADFFRAAAAMQRATDVAKQVESSPAPMPQPVRRPEPSQPRVEAPAPAPAPAAAKEEEPAPAPAPAPAPTMPPQDFTLSQGYVLNPNISEPFTTAMKPEDQPIFGHNIPIIGRLEAMMPPMNLFEAEHPLAPMVEETSPLAPPAEELPKLSTQEMLALLPPAPQTAPQAIQAAVNQAKITDRLPQEATAYAPVPGAGNSMLRAIRGNESNDNPNAQNPRSSAGGLYQFLDTTWGSVLRRMDPQRYGGMTDAQLAALKKGRDTVDLQERAAEFHLNNDIAPALARAGIPLTPGTAYLGWFQGPAGVVRAMTAPSNATVAEVFPKTISANANMRFRGKPYAQWTMNDLRQWAETSMARRMGRSEGGEVLSDKFPTHYLTNVGRQVAQAGGVMSDAIYDPMGNVLMPATDAPVEAARDIVRAAPQQTEGERALQLARDIKNYEASMARINAQPEMYRQMTHAPSKPMAPIQIEGGLIGKRNLGEAAYDVAGPMSTLAQTAYDLKTAPFYVSPLAPAAFATDVAEGLANKSPLQVSLAALGAPGKATRAIVGPAVGASVLAPEEAEAARLPKTVGIKRSTNLPNIREMTIADAIRIARREPHLIPSGEASDAFYIGGPRTIQNKRQLTKLRNQFDEYIGADPRGGDWYDRYRASVNEVTGGNPVQNKWMTSQHGQFSAGVSPESELAFAIKENNASIAGMPVKAARPAQHEAHNRAISNLDPEMMQLGDKTGEYARLISPDQARPPGATGVNDFRHARNFNYTEASGEAQRNAMTAAQHKFMDYETALAVDRANKINLGGRSNWTGEQLQAAPWVRQKALDILAERPNLVNQHMPVQLALAKAAGLEGEAAVAVARREAERLGYESAFKEANKTIGDFFGKHTAFATHEAQPGSLTGHLPGSQAASQAEREAYAADPRSSWAFAPGGRDALYAGLEVPNTGVAMRVRPTRDMQGVYTTPAGVMETNPGQVARPLVAFNSGDVKTVSEADQVIMNAAEKVRAYLDAQNAGAWHKPWVGGKAGLSNSYFLPLDRPATLDEIMNLRKSLETQGPPTPKGDSPRALLGDVSDTGSGITLTRFGETVPQWDRAQRKEVERLISQNMPVGARDMQRVSVDSGYAGLEDFWPKGSGAATREMLKDVNVTPQLREAFNNNANIPQKALMNLERDAQWSAKWGATKKEIDNARRIIGEGPGWIDRLEAALKSGVVLPAIGAALLSPAMLMQSGQTEQ